MPTIVVAEDEDDLRAVCAARLRLAGHAVSEASDGRQAVDLVRQQRPDLLVLDLWMPVLSGFEVLDALRHDPAATRLRVVVLSGLTDGDARLEAFGGGAAAFVVKGRSLDELVAAVEQALTT